QTQAHGGPPLECLCETLPFLDVAPTWRAAAQTPAGVAEGQPAASTESEIDAQRRIIAEQRALLDRQSAMIAEQGEQIAKLQQQIVTQQAQVDRLSSFALAEAPLDLFRGTGLGGGGGQGVGP